WALSSISLLCLASIFSEDLRPGDLGVFASIFAVGWLIGFFTAFAPNGIGIREGMFVLAFMSLGIPVADGVFIAMLSRLAIVAADVGCAG
ncbi:MAG: hypothetical protein GTO62_17970, partial [Planctomycetales bacterium]|nr:hypothetical protein [Planctomycetales bacterium]